MPTSSFVSPSSSGPASMRPVRDVLGRHAAGACSAHVALTQLLAREKDVARVRRMLESAAANGLPHAGDLLALLDADEEGHRRTADVLARAASLADVHGEEARDACRALFEWAATEAPDVAVAAYTAGQPDVLRVATDELVEQLARWGALDGSPRVLDLGCGAGRLARALAPRSELVIGVDLAEAMLDVARERCDGHANVAFAHGDGSALAGLADDAFDLVLAVDAFPYLVAQHTAASAFAEVARVLRPGGSFVLYNWAYDRDDATCRAEVAALAACTGFEVRVAGSRTLDLWDGLGFHLARRAGA